MFRVFCSKRVAVPHIPRARGPSCSKSMAVPRFPCTVGKALVLKFSHRTKTEEEGRSHALLGRARLQRDDGGKLPA